MATFLVARRVSRAASSAQRGPLNERVKGIVVSERKDGPQGSRSGEHGMESLKFGDGVDN